jgi:recombination protein RecA
MSAQLNNLVAARELLGRSGGALGAEWKLDTLAGRFVELSGGLTTATLTACAGLVYQAQQGGGLALWIGGRNAAFFPPDFAAWGIDLEALPVVRVENTVQAARVADTLIRSGAVTLAVLDLGSKAKLPMPVQTRLVGLAKKYHTAVIALTRKTRNDEQGQSLVSLRGETAKQRAGHDCFLYEVHVVKDKRRSPGWDHTELCCGPDGLC